MEIAEVREFFEDSSKSVKVAQLREGPNIKLLEWLTTLENTPGFYLQDWLWYGIKSDILAVPAYLFPKDIQVGIGYPSSSWR